MDFGKGAGNAGRSGGCYPTGWWAAALRLSGEAGGGVGGLRHGGNAFYLHNLHELRAGGVCGGSRWVGEV